MKNKKPRLGPWLFLLNGTGREAFQLPFLIVIAEGGEIFLGVILQIVGGSVLLSPSVQENVVGARDLFFCLSGTSQLVQASGLLKIGTPVMGLHTVPKITVDNLIHCLNASFLIVCVLKPATTVFN